MNGFVLEYDHFFTYIYLITTIFLAATLVVYILLSTIFGGDRRKSRLVEEYLAVKKLEEED